MAASLERGQLAELAVRTGLSHSHIGDILRCKRQASAGSALALEVACSEMGIPLTRMDFLYPHQSLLLPIRNAKPRRK